VLFSRLNALITIPLLIITSATGLLSALASGASGSGLQKGISPVVAALGCTAAVIHSIEKTLGLSARAQKAQGLSTSFSRLSTKIEAQLTEQHMNSASTTTPEDSARFLKTIGEDIGALLGDVTDMPKNIDALIAAALTSAAGGAIASLEGMLGHKQQAAASRGCLSCLCPPPPPPPPPENPIQRLVERVENKVPPPPPRPGGRQSGSKSSSLPNSREMNTSLPAPKPETPPPAFKIVTPLGDGRDVEAALPAPSPPPQAPYSGPSFFGVRL